MADREDVRVASHGEQLAVYLYRPDSPAGSVPCIVMAHGFSATRDDALPDYAEAFRDAGYAVALFDYRHFGASTGEPRQLIDIGRQHDDYRAVVSWARTLDGIDPRRIALFGSSFSGGHVLTVAAADPTIAAVVAQAPFTDSISTLAKVPPTTALRATVAGIRDELDSRRGKPPVLLPAVGEPGTVAAMTAPDAKPGFEAMVGPNSLWRNEFAARLMLRLPFYRPVRHAAKLRMPVWCASATRTRRHLPARRSGLHTPPRSASCGATRTATSRSITTPRRRPTSSSSSRACWLRPRAPNGRRSTGSSPMVRSSSQGARCTRWR